MNTGRYAFPGWKGVADRAYRPHRAVLAPTGSVAETIGRGTRLENQSFLATGRLTLVAIPLVAGDVVSTITFYSATTAADTPTNQWFSLWSAARARLGVTNDHTTTAWAANTAKTLTLASPVTITTSGLHYLGIVVVAATPPTLAGASVVVSITGTAPILQGTSDTGLTDPASAPATATAITPAASIPYAYVS